MLKSNSASASAQIDPKDLVKEISQLVSLPTVCIKVNEMVDDKTCSSADIGDVISHDVSLSARLLKIANSSFYGFPAKIETISRAITIIGDVELRALVLATAAIETFKNIPIDAVSMNSFWKHSLHCAIVSRLIASKVIKHQSEQLFVAGLLHDIGQLVLCQKHPKLETDALVNAALNNRDIHEEEAAIFGFDHALLGGELLSEWGLPTSLVEPVKYHHHPNLAAYYLYETSIVHIANIVAKNAQLGTYGAPYAKIEIDDDARKLINFSEQMFDNILEELPLQYASAVDLFLPKTKAA